MAKYPAARACLPKLLAGGPPIDVVRKPLKKVNDMEPTTTRPSLESIEMVKLWIPVVASFVGGLLGAAAALLASRLAHRYQRSRDREHEMRDAYSVWAAEMSNAFMHFQYMVDIMMIQVGNMALKEHGARSEVKIDAETTRKWNERGVDAFTSVRTAAYRIRLLDDDARRAKRVVLLTSGIEPRELPLHRESSAMGMNSIMMAESQRVRDLRTSTMVEVGTILESVARAK